MSPEDTPQHKDGHARELPRHSPLRHPDIEREWIIRGIEQLRSSSKAHGYLNEALQALHEKRYLEAIGFFQKAQEEHPAYPEVHYFLGIAYFLLGRYREAISHYQEVIALEPDHYGAYVQLGIAHHLMEEYDQAIRAFEEAIRLNPSLSETYVRLGNAYAAAGQRQQAIDAYAQALRIRLESLAESESTQAQEPS